MATKPTYKPELATNLVANGPLGGNNKIRPPASIRDEGWDFPSFPAREHINFQFATIDEWVDYFETVTDSGISLGANFARDFDNEVAALDFAVFGGFHRTFDTINPVGAQVFSLAPSTVTTIVVNTSTNTVQAITIDPSVDQEPIWQVTTDATSITLVNDLRVTPARTVKQINSKSGSDVTLDPDDLDDAATTHKFTSQSEIDKLAGIEPLAEVNPDVVSQAEAEAGVATIERTWTAQRVSQAISALGFSTPTGNVSSSGVLDMVLPLTGSDLKIETGTGTSTIDTNEVFNFASSFGAGNPMVFAVQTTAGGGLTLSVVSSTTTNFTIDRDDAITGSVDFIYLAIGQA